MRPLVLLVAIGLFSVRAGAATTSVGWADSDEWRMVGSNEGHTSAVTCKIKLPLRPLWRVTAADLGAPAGEPAYLHPRTLAYGVALVEMDTAHGVSLLALNAKTGEVKWRDSFPTPRLLPDAGLYPAVDDGDVALYLNQAPPGKAGGDQWNLSSLDLSNGKLEWEAGPLKLAQAVKAPATYDTLFRPVVSAQSQLLIAPDFFGRPPLVAFSWKDGSVQWRSDSTGCDIPATAYGPSDDPVALAADYTAGRPVVRSTRLKDGARGQALALPPAGIGEEWTGGVWDSQVHWSDPGTGACCVSVGRLRPEKTWPATSCVVSVPGTPQHAAWSVDGPDSLDGPILGGALFLGHWDVTPTGPDPTLRCLDVLTGRVAWSIHGDLAGKPLLAVPEMVLGRNNNGLLTAWSSVDGHVLWTGPASFLRDLIAGEGEVIGSYGQSHPSAETAFLIGYR